MDRHTESQSHVRSAPDDSARVAHAPLAQPHVRRVPVPDAESLRRRIDMRLDALAPVAGGAALPLVAAMRHALLGPGKRLRPMLVLLAGRELGADDVALLDAGCALEMVHAASLAVDDLPAMDDAALRRGRPTTHVAHGEATAILAAIGLLGRAFEVAAALPGVPPERRVTITALVARAIGSQGLAGGQIDDLGGLAGRHGSAALAACSALKTGVLFDAAIEIAGHIAGSRHEDLRPLRSFATHFAQAFQILDDLHDAGPEDRGRATHVGVLGRDGALRLLRRHVDGALSCVRADSPLAQLVRASFGSVRSAADCGVA